MAVTKSKVTALIVVIGFRGGARAGHRHRDDDSGDVKERR